MIGKSYVSKYGNMLTVVALGERNLKGERLFIVECHKCKDLHLNAKVGLQLRKSQMEAKSCPCVCATCESYKEWEIKRIVLERLKGTGAVFTTEDEVITPKSKILVGFDLNKPLAKTTIKVLMKTEGSDIKDFLAGDMSRIKGFVRIWGYKNLVKSVLKETGKDFIQPIPEEDVKRAILERLSENNWKIVSWWGRYRSKAKSKFVWGCEYGHINDKSTPKNFLDNKTNCKYCNIKNSSGNGYYHERVSEEDFLYIIDFKSYIKIGRSFDVGRRLKQLETTSGVKCLSIIALYKGTHKDVYTMEQSLHSLLRSVGNDYKKVNWSKELFTTDSVYIAETECDNCNVLQRV